VTVIERNDASAHSEDRDVSDALGELFDDEGIEVRTAEPAPLLTNLAPGHSR